MERGKSSWPLSWLSQHGIKLTTKGEREKIIAHLAPNQDIKVKIHYITIIHEKNTVFNFLYMSAKRLASKQGELELINFSFMSINSILLVSLKPSR